MKSLIIVTVSFNTWKHTLKNRFRFTRKHFTIDVRGSLINSDGFIDRAI